MPNGSDRITSHPLQELQATKTIDDPDIKAWLALGTKTKKKGGGKKKKGRLKQHVAIILFLVLHHLHMNCLNVTRQHNNRLVVFTGKKGDKPDESGEAEAMDSTNGATPQD